MEIKRRNICIIAVVLSLCISVLIVTASFAVKAGKEADKDCYLGLYENNVALYLEGRVYEVYPDIIVDNLPKQDIDQLKKGIAFSTAEEAQNAIEDYDG